MGTGGISAQKPGGIGFLVVIEKMIAHHAIAEVELI